MSVLPDMGLPNTMSEAEYEALPDPEANTSDRHRTLTRLPAYPDRGRRVRDCQIPASASGSR